MLNKTNTIHLSSSSPTLSGNIKLTVEPNDELSLGLISNYGYNNNELKKFKFHSNTKHSVNINKFLSQYIIDKESLYRNENLDLFKSKPITYTDILKTGNFSYLAPLWVTNYELPDSFIIFKVPNYIYFNQLYPLQDYHSQDYQDYFNNFIDHYLKYSEIVYVNDLNNSKLGDYIRNQYPNLLNTTYSIEDNFLNINCIDIKKGVYSNIFSHLENIDSYTEEEIEEHIKLEFEKQGVLSANMFNIEYIFNADNCDIDNNEYCFYGLYFKKEHISNVKLQLDKFNERYSLNINNSFDVYDRSEEYVIEDSEIKIDCEIDNFEIDNELYLIQDRYKKYHNILTYDNNILYLNKKKLYIDDIIGIDKNYNKQVNCELLNNKAYSNLKITLSKNKITVFNEGDYFNITSDLIDDKLEWRVIAASIDSCCGSGDICHYIPNTIRSTSSNVEIINHTSEEYYNTYNHRTLEVNITFNTIIEFEVGTYINLSWNNEYNDTSFLNSNNFEILDVNYNIDENNTTIKIVDIKGENFININTDTVKCRYKGKSYFYTYFNPVGKIEDVCKNISQSFNMFSNKIFNTYTTGTDIIIKSNFDGYYYKNMKLSYNFINSNIDISNIKINDIELLGRKIYDIENNIFFITKYNDINFNGYSNDGYTNRFSVEKDFGTENININSLVTTKFSRSKLKHYDIENTNILYSNYLENEINYKTHYIYQIENDRDDIYLSSTNTLSLNKQFYIDIYKITSVKIDNI